MNRVAKVVVASILITLILGITGCETSPESLPVSPSPSSQSPAPTASPPSSPPPSQTPAPEPESQLDIPAAPDIPPILSGIPHASGNFTLKPWKKGQEVSNGKITVETIPEGSFKDSEGFYLNEGEWVDIVVSAQLPVFWYTERPDGISFYTFCREISGKSVGSIDEPCALISPNIKAPVAGECLLKNSYSNGIYVTAIRLFAWNKADIYYIHFQNCNQELGSEVNYCVYRIGKTSEPLAPTPIPPSTPPTILSLSIRPGGGQVFSIYLRNNQTVHLVWVVTQGDKVWFHIVTPSGKSVGFYENGRFGDGTLEEGYCQGFKEGNTVFRPSQYAWGEGHYQMVVQSYSETKTTVEVSYWIED